MNLQDLRKAAMDCELTLPGGLTDADLRLLFQYLDSDNDGRIAPDELVAIVRPPLAGRRLECVREVFAKLVKATGSRDVEKALLEPSDVVEEFDASAHPDVLAGRRGADHVCREFLETFDIDGGAQGGKVTWEQWRSYYHNVSASIASDKTFVDMLCSVWHLNNNKNSIRQSSSLADAVQLRVQLNQASDVRTGSITSSRCCESLNATLGLALGESHGRALFEHLSYFSQANGDATNGNSGARFLQEQQRANGYDNANNRLPLRLVLGCLLDRLSPACLASATQVFSALQAAGNGRVFPAALASSFQASRHPAVLLGRMTTAEAFQDFARNFEVALGGSADGTVAFLHFESFCVNLRATLGTDEMLQLVLRDCFQVS
ncbi:hypothetical protein BBO99_00000469 [Phytophthora kernoviae]|uniref:EF-hand domain-containing protein n=2 Tax=Phytophthora kernoviae TaxID=325452 RepID=A0A3R7JXY2_9STRA|nr:hypothetical protein G195_003166 [Phytophthora kernoviae 00238/432]KAG2524768.1 hypothetical protein JM18_005244 [Phytophthora kernoviae]KAG2529021.1 hypothetical protein JM16_002345 [Phytophthora kernoviae]RLN32176.1 hypothetical protein BBI17_001669 [Phytophthora kernoviae]RLN85571.1 hypothetical protein BBO99_00000469 [Phytophthora kernoviae]